MVPAVHETAVGQLPGRVARHFRWRLERAFEPAAPALRHSTSRLRLRPTFLVIGAQKAGTTSLYTYLSHHPAIACARPKEVHYFNVSHDLGDHWYRSHFPLVTCGAQIRRRTGARAAVGEVTPGYIFHPHAPARVHAFAADLLLVAVLRDPVDRAHSQYRMQVRGFGIRGDGLVRGSARARARRVAIRARVCRSRSVLRLPYGLSALLRRARPLCTAARTLARVVSERADPRPHARGAPRHSLRRDGARSPTSLEVPRWRDEGYPMRSANEYEPVPDELRERLARLFEPHNRKLEGLLGRELAWTRPAAHGSASGRGLAVDLPRPGGEYLRAASEAVRHSAHRPPRRFRLATTTCGRG